MKPEGASTTQPVWRPPVYGTILRFPQNPIYAGAYAFDRTGTRTCVEGGLVRKSRGYRRPMAEWIVLLHAHHEPYIPWDRYERHQQMLADNTNTRAAMAKGAVRRGESLGNQVFQGLGTSPADSTAQTLGRSDTDSAEDPLF